MSVIMVEKVLVYLPTLCIDNCLCTLELCLQRVKRTVQATILSAQVVKCGSWPFEYGGRVACSSPSGEMVVTESGVTHAINPSSSQIVLLESKGEAMLKGRRGSNIYLSRQVISIETEGQLDVAIEAYSKSGDVTARGHVCFVPQFCNISQEKCAIADVEVVITVAWSLVATSKREVAWNTEKTRQQPTPTKPLRMLEYTVYITYSKCIWSTAGSVSACDRGTRSVCSGA
ncbi:hypothetical protein VPH35_112958 [Triticum aestivum]